MIRAWIDPRPTGKEAEEGLRKLARRINPTPEEAAKMRQVEEYKRSAFYE